MKTIPWILVGAFAALALIMHFDGCGTFGEPVITDTVYKHDTLWKRYDTVIRKTVVLKEAIHDTLPPQYLPHPDYDSLKAQYSALLSAHAVQNIYEDSVKIDSFGYVLVLDTVQYNKLGERTYLANYKIHRIIDTVVVQQQAPKKSELYYGAGVVINRTGLNFMQLGLLYKSKRQHISGISVGINPDFKVNYGVHSYWKITRNK